MSPKFNIGDYIIYDLNRVPWKITGIGDDYYNIRSFHYSKQQIIDDTFGIDFIDSRCAVLTQAEVVLYYQVPF